MTFQFEKKLADAVQAVRPPEQLVQKTEQSMHAALHRQQKKQPPRIVRYAASAACAAAICTAVFLSVWQWWIPHDWTGQPGAQLCAIDADMYRASAARTAAEQLISAPPSIQELLDTLHQSLSAQNASKPGELIADGVCKRVEYYQIPTSGQPVALLTVRLTAILNIKNEPKRLKNGDQITVVCFPPDLPNPPEDGTAKYRFSLSTSRDGNVYSPDDETLLAESAWLLHDAWPQILP